MNLENEIAEAAVVIMNGDHGMIKILIVKRVEGVYVIINEYLT